MKIEARRLAPLLLLASAILPALAQFRPALPGYRYEFPRDYFDHPDYQTEWWYYTGNLEAADGHKFGFELTFFRQGLKRHSATKSAWELKDVYYAQFALSDLGGKRFFYSERTARSGPGLAGASATQARVWSGNWSVTWRDGAEQLEALAGKHSLRLALRREKPLVIHGENGASQKSPGAGRASHYFSETRLAAQGSLSFAGHSYSVSGLAWMDHEFFTDPLETDQVGWDWFSVQLKDNSELMLFQIRRRDGSRDPFSAGTFIDAAGRATHLRAADFELLPAEETWKSPATEATYPIRWTIRVPRLGLSLDATTALPSQELVATQRAVPSYWEGAILLQGEKNSAAITGSGYLEMTGYDRPVSLGQF
jgi:predicted secreted hydrolase